MPFINIGMLVSAFFHIALLLIIYSLYSPIPKVPPKNPATIKLSPKHVIENNNIGKPTAQPKKVISDRKPITRVTSTNTIKKKVNPVINKQTPNNQPKPKTVQPKPISKPNPKSIPKPQSKPVKKVIKEVKSEPIINKPKPVSAPKPAPESKPVLEPEPKLQPVMEPEQVVKVDVYQPPMPSKAASKTHKKMNSTPVSSVSQSHLKNEYTSKIRSIINRSKRYPNQAKRRSIQGTVTVSFSIDQSGNVSNLSIHSSSGHSILDDAGKKAVLNVAGGFPPIPAELGQSSLALTIPLEYILK